MIADYPYPKRIREALKKHSQNCQNLGLLLDKYIPSTFYEKPNKDLGKIPWLQKVAGWQQALNAENLKNRDAIKEYQRFTQAAYERWQAIVKMQKAEPFSARLDWHLIVGNGGGTVRETDITLHHLYGFPIIPGSALKGLARAYAETETTPIPAPNTEQAKGETENAILSEEKQQTSEQEQVASQVNSVHPDITRIFGSQQNAGTVIFFDAMPVNGRAKLIVDIINAHYPDYYRSLEGGPITPPRNDQNPNPVPFLTVTETRFAFALAPRKTEHQADVDKAQQWLLKALSEYGIGGKTSAGYGYFQAPTPSEKLANQPPITSLQQAKPVKPVERISPTLPEFRTSQELPHNECRVISPDEFLRQRYPDANAYLRYREYSPQDIFLAISKEFEEVKDWTQGDSRSCIVSEIIEQENTRIIVCKPRPKKGDKAKQKNKKK